MDSKDIIGKPYDCNAHDIICDGAVDAHGITISAITKEEEESDRQIKICESRIKEILA